MPYDIRKRDDRWAVIRRGDADRSQRTMGTHATREQAERQRRALEAAKGR